VIVIWRPLPKKPRRPRKIVPPKFIYEFAEMFDWEENLPEKPEPPPEPSPPPLQIRAFDSVPMANLPAVLPKTRLVFRPADALLFDLITVFTLTLVLGSQRFDSPRLDALALVSVSFWVIRTIVRYSNKLARYDLLVKKFLTSKIAHRQSGALKYIATEAGSQRALRATLIHSWLVRRVARWKSEAVGDDAGLTRDRIVEEGFLGVNELLVTDRFVNVDMEAGLNDLEDLNLVQFHGQELVRIENEPETVHKVLTTTWVDVFNGDLSLKRLMGRRNRERKIVL
jgi:hypothetical protein